MRKVTPCLYMQLARIMKLKLSFQNRGRPSKTLLVQMI